MNRAQALAASLTAAGYSCTVAHDVVQIVDAPEYTEACVRVGSDVDGYLCSFAATREHERMCSAHERMCSAPGRPRTFSAEAWADWTLAVRERVAAVWPDVEPSALPSAKPLEPPVPARVVYEHDYPRHVRMDGRLEDAYQAAARECRFAVVREWRAWGRSEGDEYDAPRVTWWAWAREVAADLGADKGWATLEAAPVVADDHPAAPHVRRVLVEAAKRLDTPAGIVALDLRGIGVRTVEAVAIELVAVAQARLERDGWVRCGILICDAHAALYLARCVRLHADA